MHDAEAAAVNPPCSNPLGTHYGQTICAQETIDGDRWAAKTAVSEAISRLQEARARQQKARGQGGRIYSDGFEVDIGKTHNYEGNVIVHFTMRPKGTDKLYEEKATLQCPNGQWTVVEYSDLP